ncbi:carbon-nitrogen hydrolase [Meira miltonrushii]|uniref:Carbon-nitrogen hydrolase n=1 Tax=Meira miltonrushii TaxID=1280837 RepID=A0A316V6J9_9BASI|nr:carbon-nitrogen hydrolase [Meira miltonrushii]PWN32884.1 carbon-nitrogen hydrolase [Meira miltonrushii]
MTTEVGGNGQKEAPLRIACVQIDCKHGMVERNRDRILELTKGLKRGDVDLIMLPEMALSGYIFDKKEDIAPFLEDPSKGEQHSPSLALAVILASRLNCYVSIGFPCIGSAFQKTQSSDQVTYQITKPFDARQQDILPERWPEPAAFNASMFVDRTGKIIHTFRKHFNYTNDKVWATEGPGFECIKDVPLLGNVCVAICMDINPYDFQAPFDAFELARFCQKEEVDTLLMNIAWLASDQEESEDEGEDQKSKEEQLQYAQLQHMSYLAQRLLPLFKDQDGQPQRRLKFIACNRVGTEAGTVFAGTSVGMQFTPGSRPCVQGYMGREEGMMVIEM